MKLDDVVVKEVLKTKEGGSPTPADGIKTAANKNGVDIPYMLTAYRALTKGAGIGQRLTVEIFQQLISS